MTRAIAIDYWDKKCWIALEIQGVAIPKEVVLRTKIIEILQKYFQKHIDIDKIILWLPYDLYWKDKIQLNKTNEFKRELENKFWKKSKLENKIQIIGVDERFTSFEAENILSAFWKKYKPLPKDAISAALILETYLSNNMK